MPRKSSKTPRKTESNEQPKPETTVLKAVETALPATASNELKPSPMGGDSAETSGKRRGNNRERTADNDIKLQIRVSPEVAEILGKAAAARRCPLSNYCAILLTDWALESDATPRLSPEEQAKAEAIYKAMFPDK